MNTALFFDNSENPRRTWAWAVPLLLVVFFFAGQIISIVPVIETGLIPEDQIETYPNILYMLFVSFALPGIILAAWVKFFERRSAASVGLTSGPAVSRIFGGGYLFGLGLATASVVGIALFGGYSIEAAPDILGASFVPIGLLMLGFIVQSSVEEIFFRGWMLSRVSERFGMWAGILSNGLVFTLMHVGIEGDEPFDLGEFAIFFTMTMAFSILLSLMVIRQKSVWGACAWHAAWNWSFITWFGVPTTGIALDIKPLWVDLMIKDGAPTWLTGGSAGPENSAVTLAVLVIACFALWRGLKKKSAETTD